MNNIEKRYIKFLIDLYAIRIQIREVDPEVDHMMDMLFLDALELAKYNGIEWNTIKKTFDEDSKLGKLLHHFSNISNK